MQASPDNLSLYFLPVFPVFFVAVWILAYLVISFVSGWHTLAKRFRAQSEPYGEVRSAGPFFYTVHMRFSVHYSSVIRMVAATNALYISVSLPFRFAHPQLCIPWEEIQMRRIRFLWLPYMVLTLGEQEHIPMRISQRMARKLGILERIPD